MTFAEDPAVYFTDFAIDVYVGGVSMRGIFDAAYAESLSMVGVSPSLLIDAAEAADASLARGDAATVDGVGYTVTGIHPDGTGMVRLILEAV